MHTSHALARRRFLQFLASSPLFASPGLLSALGQDEQLIASVDQALDVFDFEAVAKKKLPPAHFGYLATGVDDDATVRANREGFGRYQLRVRRLVDVRTVDTSTTVLGTRWPTPIVVDPAGSQRAFHPDGELATARAAKARNHLQILSTVTSTAVEDVIAARGAPIWYQLYPTDQWAVTRALIKRAEAAGCPALVLTVDLQGGSNRETLERAQRRDARKCATCHDAHGFGTPGFDASVYAQHKPMFTGLDTTKVTTLEPLEMDWDFVKRLQDVTPMKLVIKGIVTKEDADAAASHGVHGVIVSNHGGRAEESGRGTIECLAEVVEGARGRLDVIVDGGFRRGTDIFKALALGARAVGVGRPYLWGLASFGQAGVESVLGILKTELTTIMRQAGTVNVKAITPSYVVDRGRGMSPPTLG